MYDDLDDGKTEVDVAAHESTPLHPSSIAPISMNVEPPLSMHDRSTSFSWPPPAPARPSSLPIYIVSAVSLVAVLGLLVSFALSETAPAPAAVVVPRSVVIHTSKSASFTSAPNVAR